MLSDRNSFAEAQNKNKKTHSVFGVRFVFSLLKKAVPSAGRGHSRFFLNLCGRSKFLKHFFGKGNCFVAAGAKIGRSVVTCGNNYGFSAIGAKNFDALVFIVILKINGHSGEPPFINSYYKVSIS